MSCLSPTTYMWKWIMPEINTIVLYDRTFHERTQVYSELVLDALSNTGFKLIYCGTAPVHSHISNSDTVIDWLGVSPPDNWLEESLIIDSAEALDYYHILELADRPPIRLNYKQELVLSEPEIHWTQESKTSAEK